MRGRTPMYESSLSLFILKDNWWKIYIKVSKAMHEHCIVAEGNKLFYSFLFRKIYFYFCLSERSCFLFLGMVRNGILRFLCSPEQPEFRRNSPIVPPIPSSAENFFVGNCQPYHTGIYNYSLLLLYYWNADLKKNLQHAPHFRWFLFRLSPVSEFVDPVFTKTSPKRSFSLNRKRALWLVFAKTGARIYRPSFHENKPKTLVFT